MSHCKLRNVTLHETADVLRYPRFVSSKSIGLRIIDNNSNTLDRVKQCDHLQGSLVRIIMRVGENSRILFIVRLTMGW
jgi:hypothetical protein